MPGLTSPTTVTTTLSYFSPPVDGEKPYQKVITDPETGDRSFKRNWSGDERSNIVIENLRGKEETVSLDKTGFQFFQHTSNHTSFVNDEEIKAEYYPESVELIKKLTGATRVEIFDHTIRKHLPELQQKSVNGPVPQVHIDQSAPASIARVHRHMPVDEVPKLLEQRFQIINLWRPIHHAAYDWPLALCDYRSVDPVDVVPVALIFPDREGETLGVKYNPNHKWKYLRGMTPDEIVLIKCFDSIQDGSVAVYTPHTGFKDPSTPEEAIPRESIELRALVFYD
ncbi:Hydroxylase/desaturase CTB9 [Psilocybe cubensis]|uniref:7alpha-cephem-methoxylase P8 chain n=2 Tax=Psilocybe cubensis TaxID=181762 RepID=A0A8H8CFR5_PSICU|nr:Hydroxylase/desaturase CTB9 [Psilocybe cubensis]KAH9477751.1 Hydroxylase/desaturase CTB9 [Psilocybe cubensis]